MLNHAFPPVICESRKPFPAYFVYEQQRHLTTTNTLLKHDK